MSRARKVLTTTAVVIVGIAVALYFIVINALEDKFIARYQANCSVCHGEHFEGTPLGKPLIGVDLVHGDSIEAISQSISTGFPTTGMPAWSEVLDESEIRSVALLIAEVRMDRNMTDFKVDAPLEIPTGIIQSERHDFRIESFATGLHPLPFSIAPLPDGRFLLSEKTQGLSIISIDGEQSALIEGTPQVHDDAFTMMKLEYGIGWMLDVALHPDYEENGWIYIHYGDRCDDCNKMSRMSPFAVSMNKLVRGRIENGVWIDQETVWQADKETYTPMPDIGAGGRISFDDEGHVFISVGIKGQSNYHGIQDLSLPYGKIHRIHDDGRVPADNPFVDVPSALASIWTYGHRSPQGLEFNHHTRQMWSTEMGPRGGDELNLLLPGRNYGWPLYSKGMDYDGTPAEYGKELGIVFDLNDIEQTVVDLTPAPAISSFIFYQGDAFAGWQNNIIVGSLKATELYRMVLVDNQMTHMETLIKGLARIRDVELGADGNIYLLLEHASGGQIVRLVPAPLRSAAISGR